MMVKENFFESQSDLTANKIMFFRSYLQHYLAKVLMQFGRCFLADFFCGPGKNGPNDGSPLALLDCATKMLSSPILKKKWPNAEIVVFFSDENEDVIENLKGILKSRPPISNIRIHGPYCASFHAAMKQAADIHQKILEPKFFFLDPFGYSDVSIAQIKNLMECLRSEVLLFLQTFHSYRFHKNAAAISALKTFLEEFSSRGCVDYANIDDFNESIRQKLLARLGLKFVRAIKLDDGKCKNALFYLTKHITGMQIMNDLAWKYAQDGVSVKTGSDEGPTLFDLSTATENFSNAKRTLIDYLKNKQQVSNVDIISFVAENCFSNEYAREILGGLKKLKKIAVEHLNPNKTKGFYVANNHWNSALSIIKYIG